MCSNVFKCVQSCSKLVQTCSNVFKCVQMCSNVFKLVQNLFKCVQMCSNVFKCVQIWSNTFKLVKNFFKCVQTCLKLGLHLNTVHIVYTIQSFCISNSKKCLRQRRSRCLELICGDILYIAVLVIIAVRQGRD